MCRVLLIDDDTGVIETVGLILRLAGHDVATAKTGHDGLQTAKEFEPDVALIDGRLKDDASGMDVLRELRTLSPSTACIMVTGSSDVGWVVEATKLGAKDFVQKPIFDEELVALVERASAIQFAPNNALQQSLGTNSLSRWADAVERGVRAPKDPRTLDEWGRDIGASEVAIRDWCHAARVHPLESLLLTRVLRAVVSQQRTPAAPEHLLDIVDRIALKKLLLASGGTEERLPPSVDDLLNNQYLIKNEEAIDAMRFLLAERGYL